MLLNSRFEQFELLAVKLLNNGIDLVVAVRFRYHHISPFHHELFSLFHQTGTGRNQYKFRQKQISLHNRRQLVHYFHFSVELLDFINDFNSVFDWHIEVHNQSPQRLQGKV
jgi:hypothetical protein